MIIMVPYNIAVIIPEAGMVNIHAHTIRPATDQRTARIRRTEPTPMIAPVMVCVFDTDKPRLDDKKSVNAPAVSAANPPRGCSLVILLPTMLIMRQPPESVLKMMAA